MNLLAKYWFLIGLALAVTIGFVGGSRLEPVSSAVWLRRCVVMLVMFVMALPLPLSMIVSTLRRPWPALLASFVNFGLLPLVAWVMSAWVDSGFQAGFLVIAATPCTLASAAVWTRRAGGNDVTAMMTTVITNLFSFLITPLVVLLLMNQQASIPFVDLVTRIGLLVVLPILVAQMVARIHGIGKWAIANKKRLGIIAQSGILWMVLTGAARSSVNIGQDQVTGVGPVVWLVGVCGCLHITVLYAGLFLARWLNFDRGNQIAVAISGSQKTLMIGLLVCVFLKSSVVPMVVYHAVQLIIDTFISDRWTRSIEGPSETC